MDTRQTNNRVSQRWWTCDRCGNDYPEGKMVTTRGFIMCTGATTHGCADDHYGRQHFLKDQNVPYEITPDTPPNREWDDI